MNDSSFVIVDIVTMEFSHPTFHIVLEKMFLGIYQVLKIAVNAVPPRHTFTKTVALH